MAGFKTPRSFPRGETVNIDTGSLEQDLYKVSLATGIIDARAFGGLDDVVIGLTKEQMITAAIQYAVGVGATAVFVPKSMRPYTASLVTFNSAVQMVDESLDLSKISIQAYGAKGDGVVDDTIALQTALNIVSTAGGGMVFCPQPTQFYRVASSFSIPANVILAAGSRSTIIKRDHANDMVTSIGANAGLRNITLDGNSATYPTTGRGVVVATNGTPGIVFDNVAVINFPLACVDFAVADAGTEFTSIACSYFTSGAVGSVAAIKVSGTDSAAVPRKFYATTSGGCTLFDFGNCNDFFASGFYTNGLIFGASSAHIMINNMRCGAAGGTVTIKGGSHSITTSVFAAAVILFAGSSGIYLDAEVPSFNITDNGSSNYFRVFAGYTPTWTGTPSPANDPVIGNGSITGLINRSADGDCTVHIRIVIGGSTTLGGGQWFVSLPYLDYSSYRYVGSFWSKISASGVRNTGIARVVPGLQKVEAVFNASATPWSPAQPIAAPAVGDEYEISITYRPN